MRTTHLMAVPLLLAALSVQPVLAQDAPPQSPRMAAESAAMVPLAALAGEWHGTGWNHLDGQQQARSVTMRVSPQLGGATVLLEQRSYGPEGALAFQSFNNVAYNVDRNAHVIQARAEGRFGEFPFTVTPNGYVWQIGNALRYTGTLEGETWTEVTEALTPDGPQEIASFTVTRAAPVLAPAPVDLSGFWELRADSKHVPNAQLTEAFVASGDHNEKFNDWVIMASRWCHPLGTPFVMGDSAPLDLVQSGRELAIIAEVQSSARHVYLDGRDHIPLDEFDPTSTGESIGHWEGNVLVVDTQGFNRVGNRSIPGGGLRGETSHLVERYQLRNNGQELNVQFTWDDPNVFAAPHTYDFTYYRGQPDEFAREYFCDATDEGRGGTAATYVGPE